MRSETDPRLEIKNSIHSTTKTPVDLADNDPHVADIADYLLCIQQHLFVQALNKTALIYAEKTIPYAVLGHKVHQLMLAIDRLDLKKAAVVALYVQKSPEYIYSVLACALKGLIWLPIDMDAPVLRRDYLLANSRVDLVISNHAIEGYPCLLIDEIFNEYADINVGLNADTGNNIDTDAPSARSAQFTPALLGYKINRDPAYYLYTSGSTGTPKCVVLNNLATANVIAQSIEKWQMSAEDVIMAVTPFHHDMSVFDIFASLALGATLFVPSVEQSKNAVAWASLVQQYQVTIWISVPAIVEMLCSVADPAQLQSLRLIAQGGDYIKPRLIEKLRAQLPHARLFSLGGPTETTIWSIWHEIVDQDQDIIPYGQALKHNQYFILDEQLQPCSVGELGRMYMLGINLSNAYLLDGEISSTDFVQIKNSEHSTQNAFRMSDLGYLRADGNIIFAGREEGYLKVKGVRISAVEVETILLKYTSIQDVVIVSCRHPQTETAELVAVFSLVAFQDNIDIPALKRALKKYLPTSHIPTQWYCVDKLPLTQNAKIDRKLLQKIAQQHLYPAAEDLQNNQVVWDDIADTVLAVFQEMLTEQQGYSPRVFYHTEILKLGIRSKQLKQIAQKIFEKYGIRLDFYALARCKTIQDVVRQVQIKAQLE